MQECGEHCAYVCAVLEHLRTCSAGAACPCHSSKLAIRHHQTCSSPTCLLCGPIYAALSRRCSVGASAFDHMNQAEVSYHISLCRGLTLQHGECAACGSGDLPLNSFQLECSQCASPIAADRQQFWTARPPGKSPVHVCCGCFASRATHRIANELVGRSAFSRARQPCEPWAGCTGCGRRFHRACVLALEDSFVCHDCRQPGSFGQTPLSASTLRESTLSKHIEWFISLRLRDDALHRGVSPDDTSAVPHSLFVRTVHAVDREVSVGQRYREAFPEAPAKIPYRSRTVMLFQKVGGVDVLLLALFAGEYGEGAGVSSHWGHVAYLEGSPFLEPRDIKSKDGRSLRTFVFHTFVAGYLSFLAYRGFHRAHIWSCPPRAPHADYVLHGRSEGQTPLPQEKLNAWYSTLLDQAMRENVVVSVAHPTCASEMPYLDSDFWPEEVERQGAENAFEVVRSLSSSVFLVNLNYTSATTTSDPDAPISSSVCDTRFDLLDFFKNNGLQFNSVRRARLATATLLRFLHRPTLYVPCATCDQCGTNVVEEGWQCAPCDFDLCNICYAAGAKHEHSMACMSLRKPPLLVRGWCSQAT